MEKRQGEVFSDIGLMDNIGLMDDIGFMDNDNKGEQLRFATTVRVEMWEGISTRMFSLQLVRMHIIY